MKRSNWIDIVLALGAIGAGIYMLQTQSASSDSIFNPFLHGIGVYFIAKGLFMARSLHMQARQLEALERMSPPIGEAAE